jgi:hypothetical protein
MDVYLVNIVALSVVFVVYFEVDHDLALDVVVYLRIVNY